MIFTLSKISRYRYWLLFGTLSATLFYRYYYHGKYNAEAMAPFLKGLTSLQHFYLHFTIGIFFGFLIVIVSRIFFQKQLNVPIVLFLSVLWSHFPDIRFAFRHKPHDTWEIIFFLHTKIDEYFPILWIIIAADIVLVFLYVLFVRRKTFY